VSNWQKACNAVCCLANLAWRRHHSTRLYWTASVLILFYFIHSYQGSFHFFQWDMFCCTIYNASSIEPSTYGPWMRVVWTGAHVHGWRFWYPCSWAVLMAACPYYPCPRSVCTGLKYLGTEVKTWRWFDWQVTQSCPPDNWREVAGEWDPGSDTPDDGRSFFYHKWCVSEVLTSFDKYNK